VKPFTVKSVFRVLLDIVEVFVPIVAFLTIFVCFLLQIGSRYFFTPLMWPEELALISFLWVALLGACYAKRDNSMVAFSLVYDLAGPKVQRRLRIGGNAFIAVILAVSFKPSLDYVIFMSFRTSGALQIPMSIAFSCYIIFLVDIIIRYVIDVIQDLRGKVEESAK
jgi:TRAP-type C4-dicarboxylate transport system permease small subunit